MVRRCVRAHLVTGMRSLFLLLLLSALAGHAAQPLTQKEALDMFFKSVDARQRFGEALEALKAMGVEGVTPLLSRWRGEDGAGGLLMMPWHRPEFMAGLQRGADDGLDKLVEEVRRYIETAAEPLKIESISLNRSGSLAEVVGYVKDASISHLSTFNILDMGVDLLSVNATLAVTFDKLDAHGLYDVDATASQQLHVFGNGHFDVRLYQPTVKVNIRLGYNEEHFSVEDLQIYVKMEKLKVIMSNFLGGGEVGDLVCGIVSDVGPAFLDMYRDEVNALISSDLKGTANALLAKVPISTIIDWINAITGGDGNDDSS